MNTPDLIRALGGADAICKAGCSCRGSYTGSERRKAHRDVVLTLDSPSLPSADPDCRYCGGSGLWIGGDEEHLCWCRR